MVAVYEIAARIPQLLPRQLSSNIAKQHIGGQDRSFQNNYHRNNFICRRFSLIDIAFQKKHPSKGFALRVRSQYKPEWFPQENNKMYW